MMQPEEQSAIYLGPRDETFKALITSLLERGKIKPKYIESLVTPENMKIYGQAFTAESADKETNYEIFEQLGDVSANKFLVWYFYRRFPQLECPLGVKVVARLRINYGAKQSFAKIGESLGFWPFISATEAERSQKKKSLLEDCLESFVGCTEQLLDKQYRPGVGYAIVYDILASVFDQYPISLEYNDLYDPKTRLKELFDVKEYKKTLGSWTFVDSRDEDAQLAESYLYQIPPGFTAANKDKLRQIGVGRAAKKPDAQQKAAKEGLKTLQSWGFVKKIPEEYKLFCN